MPKDKKSKTSNKKKIDPVSILSEGNPDDKLQVMTYPKRHQKADLLEQAEFEGRDLSSFLINAGIERFRARKKQETQKRA